MVTTHFDEQNQVFLTANCDRLQDMCIPPHSLFVTDAAMSLLEKLYAAQGSNTP